MSSMGRPPTPPLALISSTAISIDSLAVCPHSAPLPVNEAKQPTLTLLPESFCALAASIVAAIERPAAKAAIPHFASFPEMHMAITSLDVQTFPGAQAGGSALAASGARGSPIVADRACLASPCGNDWGPGYCPR